HRADAVAPLLGHETRDLDRLQRRLPQRWSIAQPFLSWVERAALALPAPLEVVLGRDVRHHLVHRHEPLRRAAEDHLGLGSPRVWIAVWVIGGCREKCPSLAQVRADRPVGRVELGVDDRALAAAPEPILAIFAVALDRELGADAV